jgi:hypothetical protein
MSTQEIQPFENEKYSDEFWANIYGTICGFGFAEAKLSWARYSAFLIAHSVFLGLIGRESIAAQQALKLILLSIAGFILTLFWMLMNSLGWIYQNRWYWNAARLNFTGIRVQLPTNSYLQKNAIEPISPMFIIVQLVAVLFVFAYAILLGVGMTLFGLKNIYVFLIATSSTLLIITTAFIAHKIFINKVKRKVEKIKTSMNRYPGEKMARGDILINRYDQADTMNNKLDTIKVVTGIIAILSLIILGTFWNIRFSSEGILGITTIVILWYTWETSQIRKAEVEISKDSRTSLIESYRPAVGHLIYTDKNIPYDTRIKLINLSDYAVAVNLHCNLKVDGEPIGDFSAAYEGKDYWNLQFKEEKEGHFSVLDMYLKQGLIEENEIQKIKEAGGPADIKRQFHKTFAFRNNNQSPSTAPSNPPEISMDVEIFACNDKRQEAYYPPVHYRFDSFRMAWIPTVTNTKPYWEFDRKPNWIKSNIR